MLGQLLGISQTYLLVPLFLAAWGDEGYGRWLTLTAMASYLALLDLGGQSYIGNRLAASFAHERYDEFRTTLRQGFSLFALVGTLAWLVVAGVLASPWLHSDADSRLVVFWYATAVVLAVPGGVLVSCYPATVRVVRGASVGNIIRLLSMIALMVALQRRCTMPQYSAIVCATGIVLTWFAVADLHRQLPDLFRPAFRLRDLRDGVALLRGSFLYWMFPVTSALNNQGVILVLAATYGDAAVASFVTHRAAASLITYGGGLLRPALWTEMTFMAARSDFPKMRDVVSLAIRVNTWTASVLGLAVCLAAPLGYALWTRSKLELDVVLLMILAAQAVLSAAWSTASWPLMAANEPRAIARWSLANATLTVAGSFFAARLGWGIRSIAAASLIADVFCGLIPFPAAAFAFMRGTAWHFARDAGRAFGAAVPFAIIVYLCFHFLATSQARILAFAGASLVLAWPTALLLLGARDIARITAALRRRTI